MTVALDQDKKKKSETVKTKSKKNHPVLQEQEK